MNNDIWGWIGGIMMVLTLIYVFFFSDGKGEGLYRLHPDNPEQYCQPIC